MRKDDTYRIIEIDHTYKIIRIRVWSQIHSCLAQIFQMFQQNLIEYNDEKLLSPLIFSSTLCYDSI